MNVAELYVDLAKAFVLQGGDTRLLRFQTLQVDVTPESPVNLWSLQKDVLVWDILVSVQPSAACGLCAYKGKGGFILSTLEPDVVQLPLEKTGVLFLPRHHDVFLASGGGVCSVRLLCATLLVLPHEFYHMVVSSERVVCVGAGMIDFILSTRRLESLYDSVKRMGWTGRAAVPFKGGYVVQPDIGRLGRACCGPAARVIQRAVRHHLYAPDGRLARKAAESFDLLRAR